MKLSIRWGVILACILLVWGSQLILMPVSIYSSRRVMLDHTRDIMENILDLTLEETRNYFAMARGAAHLTERLIASKIVNTDKNSMEKLERYFCDQLDLYPQFAGIYFATPAGEFYYVNREPDPDRGVFRFKLIGYDGEGRRTTRFVWRDRDRNILAEKIDFKDDYDPRTRPWYTKAVTEKSIIWTDPYIFFSSGKPGITTAGPLVSSAGEIQGVVGVDIELDVLSAFVGKLRVGKTGLAFIINQNTDVIAFPGLSGLLEPDEGQGRKIRLPQLDELENPLCRMAFDAVTSARETPPSGDQPLFASFEHGGSTYYTMFTRVQGQKISWTVGVYIPEEDYLGAIKANQRMTLILTLAASVLATIGGLAVSKRMTDPISALAVEARRIRHDDYSLRPRIKSLFGEIQRTADSFFEMKTAVETYKKELRRKEAIHRAITDTANEAIVMKDDTGVISYWNPAAATLLGYDIEEAMGRQNQELRPFSRQFNEEDLTLHSLFRKDSDYLEVKTMEITITHRSGREIPAEVSMVTIPIEGKSHAILVIRDISNRKRHEEEKLAIWSQLQQARKMEAIGTLAGGIAHDFNNILSGILGHADLLQAGAGKTGPEAEHIEGIVAAAERARDLVRQILAFSFQDHKKLVPLFLPEIIQEACRLMASSLPKTIGINWEIQPDCPMAMGDATQIHQVALNLMTNAFQAMEKRGGTISVRLGVMDLEHPEMAEGLDLAPGSYLCYEVADTGVGIPPQTMDRIFDPYFTTKPEGRGTGLGLAVIKGIVQNHGGGIQVESAVGEGSRFRVFLPAAAPGSVPEAVTRPARIRKGTEHILLVDDQKDVINVERQVLEVLGYKVTSRLSGQEALETFVQDPGAFDLVVTDMSMPGMTGEDLSRRLMEIRPEIPVILLTGYSETMSPDQAGALGIRNLIMKPVRLRDFSEAIRRELDHRGERQS